MVQLAPGRVAERPHDLRHRPRSRQARGEAGLEARSGGEWGKRGAEHRGSVDQRRQLRPDGRVATGQEAVESLIKAFSRRARWQAMVSSVRSGSVRRDAAPVSKCKHRDPADRYASATEEGSQVAQGSVQQDPGRTLGAVHHLADLA